MKKLKKILSVAMAVMVMTVSATAAYAAPSSPSKVAIGSASTTTSKVTFNGKAQTPEFTITVDGKKITQLLLKVLENTQESRLLHTQSQRKLTQQ